MRKCVREIAFQIMSLCSNESGAVVLNIEYSVVLSKSSTTGNTFQKALPHPFHCVVHKTVCFPNVTFVFSLSLFATA